MISVRNLDSHSGPPDYTQVWAETHRLDGPDGFWTGTARGFAMTPTRQPEGMLVLTGEGAYEGFSAMFVMEVVPPGPDEDEHHTLMTGYIIEGELPPMPLLIEPPAE